MENELLLCPFCGGSPDWELSEKGMNLLCLGCGVRTPKYHDRAIVIGVWNART